MVAIAKPPPDDDDLDTAQVVILENLEEDGEIRIKDIQSGDQIYSTSYKELGCFFCTHLNVKNWFCESCLFNRLDWGRRQLDFHIEKNSVT